jgi:hypothetical protein
MTNIVLIYFPFHKVLFGKCFSFYQNLVDVLFYVSILKVVTVNLRLKLCSNTEISLRGCTFSEKLKE